MPKPDDWDEYINVTGYFFLNEGVRGSYQPPKELADFLAAGPPPVYLGEAHTRALLLRRFEEVQLFAIKLCKQHKVTSSWHLILSLVSRTAAASSRSTPASEMLQPSSHYNEKG